MPSVCQLHTTNLLQASLPRMKSTTHLDPLFFGSLSFGGCPTTFIPPYLTLDDVVCRKDCNLDSPHDALGPAYLVNEGLLAFDSTH